MSDITFGTLAAPGARHLRRIAIRLITGIGVVWGAATLTFIAVHVMPGDPAYAIAGAASGGNSAPSAAVIALIRRQYGFNKPVLVQYLDYLGQLLHGNLGNSYQLQEPVTEVIGQQIGATVQLAIAASVVSIVLAVVVALATAKRRWWVRSTASGAELVFASMPSFWLGLLLLTAFAYHLHWFPAIGSQGLSTLVLPSFTIALPIAAVLSQVLRNSLEDTLEQPFITTARARGLGEAGVRLRHAFRHCLAPLLTLSGFVIGGLFGGAVITESLFSRQGIGRILLTAVQDKDMPVVMGIVLLAAVVYVVVNIIVDLLHPVIDPRLKESVL